MATQRLAPLVLGALILSVAACSKHSDSSAPAAGDAGSATGASAGGPGASAPSGGSTFSFGSGFEGGIVLHSTTPHGTNDMVIVTKGGKLRVEVPSHDGQTAHSIFDPASKQITVLMESQHLAMQMPIPSTNTQVAAANATNVTRTGKHETVAGYDCEDWDITTADGKRESTCVAQGLAFFDFSAMAGPTSGATRSWAEELRDKNAFPLRAVEYDPAGKEISRMEVTKIEKKAIDDSAFAIPPGYHVMNVPGMGMGMGAMPHPKHP
jgi:hypothetical protein